MKGLFIRIERKRASYNYKKFSNKIDAWDNNDNNNMLDDFIFFVDEARMHWVKCQSIANIPFGRFSDTIAPGRFQLKAFVENRQKYGRIHGIVNAYDLEGQRINENSIETIIGKNGAPIDFNRWLCHDLQKNRPEKPGIDTRVAWSAGCIIMSDANLEVLGILFDAYKVLPGDLIDGEIIEVD